ncbi:hypothetical protein B6D52_03480 [Candidatus Parcubacteria bacterium 4484_255]|nr:MAG: hypothetical protein B6D52_03480 [Candidatus Parcubacteria bacterium 4484_255]
MKQDKLTSLLAYVPKHLSQRMIDNIKGFVVSDKVLIEGAVIVAELSGLTNLFEALAKTGEASTKELNEICSDYFNSVFGEVEKYGGDILYFDSSEMYFLVIRKPRQHYSTCVRTAGQITLDIQKKMLKFNQINTSAGIFSMTMKTAVTVGEIYHTVIGQKGKQAQYIYTAPIFEEAKNALHHAIPGQVLISDYAIAKACGIELEEPQKLYSPISRTTKSISKVGYEPIDIKNISVRDKIRLTEFLSSFVPKEIFRNLHVQGKISEGDRRRVTILALSFEGINFQNEKTTKIQNYLTSIFDTVEETSGYIFNILSDKNGGHIFIAFGAPILSKNQENRAIYCALKLMNLMTIFKGIKQRIGITTGFMYAGVIGSIHRKKYCLIGNTLKLAVSVVNSAKNEQIWVDKYVYERTVDTSEYIKLDPIMISGYSWPIQIYQLLHLKSEFDKSSLLPQKEDELDYSEENMQFYTLIHNVLSNKPQIITICGDESNRTKLSHKLLDISQESGLMTFSGKCVSGQEKKPFSLWKEVFIQFFELDTALSNRDKQGKLVKMAQMINPQLTELIPLFADVLPIELKETERTKALKPKERKKQFFYLLKEIFLHHIAKHPTLFLLENADFADELSEELLEKFIRFAKKMPVLIALTCTNARNLPVYKRYPNKIINYE